MQSVTDRSKPVNQRMSCANLSTIDIKESMFETNGVSFNPSKLDIACSGRRKVVAEAVVKMLQKIADISNSSIAKNADGLLSNKSADIHSKWAVKSNSRLPSDKYKLLY